MALEAGIDEAGRGPVLGPMVVAGVAGEPDHVAAIGVKDSKRLVPGRREQIARELRLDADVIIDMRVVEASAIDAEMTWGTLNTVGLRRFQDLASVLHAAGAGTVVVDAADVDADRFGRAVAEALPPEAVVVSMHRAEEHPCVAAASIVAKVERDRRIARLARVLERRLSMEMGSGYPADPKTKAFLAAWVARFGDLPEGARRRWAPARALLAPQQAELPFE